MEQLQMSFIETNEDVDNNQDTIEVVKVNFEESYDTTWKELFSGYERLYAITFSYGLGFIKDVLKGFDYAEIILGCEPMVKFDLQTLMAHQNLSIKNLQKNKYLVDRISNDELKFYISKEVISHQKVFILEGENQKTRIITGSGNFSGKAFRGKIIENFEVMDNDLAAHEYYMGKFQCLKEISSTEVVKESLFIDYDDDSKAMVEELPITKEVKHSNIGIIIEEAKQESEQVDFAYNLKELAKIYAKIVPVADKGKTLLTADSVKKMLVKHKKNKEEDKIKKAVYPQFTLDYENERASLNGKQYRRNQSLEEVKSDIINIMEYFDGFDQFEGDSFKLKKQYFKMMNYMLLSPFIANLRYKAFLTDYPTRLFPMYAILYGDSDAGKSAFIETIHTLMFGKKLGNISPSAFTRPQIQGLQHEVKGVPLHIEDLLKTRFNQYVGEIVKYDEYLLENRLLNYPTFIISSNDIKTVKPEYSKRIIVTYVEGNLPKIKATTNHKKILSIRKAMTTNFYCEYLTKMFPAVNQLMIDMESNEETENWIPDIFNISSKIIIDIFSSCGVDIPEYVTEVNFEDYFGSAAIGSRVYNKVRLDWKYNKKAFEVSRKKNKLIYQPGENQYEATWTYNELPTELRAECSGSRVIMELDKAEDFFGVTFKRSIFGH